MVSQVICIRVVFFIILGVSFIWNLVYPPHPLFPGHIKQVAEDPIDCLYTPPKLNLRPLDHSDGSLGSVNYIDLNMLNSLSYQDEILFTSLFT